MTRRGGRQGRSTARRRSPLQGQQDRGAAMDDRDAIAALISDLHWQIDQLRPRGIKDSAGNPYNPSYYKRGLQEAARGGLTRSGLRGFGRRREQTIRTPLLRP